jgi:PspA-Associated protein
MILRILGEGQFEIDEDKIEELNRLDDQLIDAVESGDEESFRLALNDLLVEVRAAGRPVPDEYLGESDLILPGSDATVDEVQALLGDEGLIPG